MDTIGWFTFSLLFLWITYLNFRYLKKINFQKKEIKESLKRDIREGTLSFAIEDYYIDPKGKRRSNSIERRFKRRYFFDLLETFKNKCFHCKRTLKLECDHFFIPKSLGGNLMVMHKSGYWVCNTILLCRSCNSKKEDKRPEEYFTHDELLGARERIEEMSLIITEREL